MDAIFLLSEVERANFLQSFMGYLGSTYICLWSYLPQPSNCLLFWGGYYLEENNQPSSSTSESVARRLFDQYQRERFAVNDHVPGLAFKNSFPYLELKEIELRRMASADAQRQFYQEARIKTAVFMGCRSGEIELGWSNVSHEFTVEYEMRNWFSEDFSRQSPLGELSQAVEPNRLSSSSSSLRSLSIEDPEISSLIFNVSSSSHIPEALQEASSISLPPMPSTSTQLQNVLQLLPLPSSTSNPLQQALQFLQPTPSSTSSQRQAVQSFPPLTNTTNPLQQAKQPLQAMQSSSSPHQQAMQAFALERNVPFPSPEIEDAAMTRAILAVLSTAPSSSSSSSTSTHNLPHSHRVRRVAGAFENYRSALAPKTQPRGSLLRQSMLKRVITYYRSLNFARREHMLAGQPTSTQLHHMISERRRREKINESFQALRSILPPQSKKDKASVLNRTREYLASLEAQVEQLTGQNQELEAQLSKALASTASTAVQLRDSSNERLVVRVTPISESTSAQRIVDLQVILRGERPISDVVIRILEFLKQDSNVHLMSIEASTHTAESTSFSRVILRLNIEGNDWDEAAFQEAIKRVVADFAR